MSLGSAYEDDAIQALANTPVVPQPATEAKFSAWRAVTAVPRGVNEAIAQVAATGADMLGSLRYMRDATPEQRRQMDRAGAPIESFSSDSGDELRKFGREFRPDPLTAHAAEQVVYGFSRGATKIAGGAVLGGPAGMALAGLEEGVTQSDELRLMGVDVDTRTKVGAVQGAGLALSALPIVGQTRLATAGLYAIGGPGGFVAQQAATREILQSAGYDRIGAQFDPFDPVGLAVATLLPAGFAAYGLRQQKLQRAAASLPDLPPRADAVPPAEPAAPVPIPSRLSPITQAVRAYPTEAVDAARVVLLAERRAAANPGAPDSLRAMDQHEAALTRAEDQIATGEPVQVADLAPAPRVPAVEAPEFMAWFGDSKVVDADGKPLVVYHGTTSDIEEFTPSSTREGELGIWLTDSRGYADWIATKGSRRNGGGANTVPVYVSMANPKVIDVLEEGRRVADQIGEEPPATPREAQSLLSGSMGWDRAVADLRDEAERQGHDGLVLQRFDDEYPGGETTAYVAFRPEQIKSAIGNTGRFDPATGSLTDSPYATWADQITAAIREMQAQARPTDAPTTTQATNPERPTPARGAGDPAATGAADPGRSAAGVEAAGLTPADGAAILADALRPVAPGVADQIDNLLGRSAPADAAHAETVVADRMEMVRQQFPTLEVMVDGMDKPMPMAEFLAAAKTEADDLAADAPLIQTAAECALLHGF